MTMSHRDRKTMIATRPFTTGLNRVTESVNVILFGRTNGKTQSNMNTLTNGSVEASAWKERSDSRRPGITDHNVSIARPQ